MSSWIRCNFPRLLTLHSQTGTQCHTRLDRFFREQLTLRLDGHPIPDHPTQAITVTLLSLFPQRHSIHNMYCPTSSNRLLFYALLPPLIVDLYPGVV